MVGEIETVDTINKKVKIYFLLQIFHIFYT